MAPPDSNFWNLTAIFSTEKEEVTPVDDPAREEVNDLKNIPLISPLLAAIFKLANLPKDEELTVDADDKYETAPKDYWIPVRLPRITEDHLLTDRVTPLLKVFHVTNGRLHSFSSPVTVRGIAEDTNGIASLKINGTPIPMRSRVFTKKLHVPLGEYQTLIKAENNSGNIAYFQFKLVRKPEPPPRLAAMKEPGVHMVQMAGSATTHIVKMPGRR
jgi:hypothetical protein